MIQEMKEKEAREPRFWTHAQPLSDGKYLPSGRAWLFFGERYSRGSWLHIGVEWTFAEHILRRFALSFDFAGEEEDLQFRISLPIFFSLWISIESSFLHWLFLRIKQGFGYETSIEINHESIRLHILNNEIWGARRLLRWLPGFSIHCADRPGFGIQISFYFLDLLFGRREYSEEKIGEPSDHSIILFPDIYLGIYYLARVQMKKASWKRPRSPYVDSVLRAEIELLTPIPIPGKGENSYDQEDDAIHDSVITADTPEAALYKLIHSIQKTREEYGLPVEISRRWNGVSRFN